MGRTPVGAADSANSPATWSAGNAIAGIADQILSSITNFGASGMALFVLDVADFGIFVAVQALYGVAVAIFRAVIGEPLLHPFGVVDLDESSALRAAAALGLALTVPLALIAAAFGASWSLVGALIFAMPLLLVQDAVRYLGFAAAEPLRAVWVDAVWFAIQFGALGIVLVATDQRSLLAVAGPWLLGGALSGALFGLLGSPTPAAVSFLSYLRSNQVKLKKLLRENLSGRLAPSIAVVVVGLVLSDAEVGEAFTPRTVLGPVNIFFVSATSYGLAVAKRQHNRSEAAFGRFIRLLSFGLPAIAAAAGVIVLALPISAIRWITDIDVTDFRWSVLVVSIGMCFAGLNHARRVRLRILGRVDLTARVETWAAGILIAFAALGSITFGPFGAIGGIALTHLVSTALWFRAEHLIRQRQVAL